MPNLMTRSKQHIESMRGNEGKVRYALIKARIAGMILRQYSEGIRQPVGVVIDLKPCARCGASAASMDATDPRDVHCRICAHRQGHAVAMSEGAIAAKAYTSGAHGRLKRTP